MTEIFALLGCYAALLGSYWCIATDYGAYLKGAGSSKTLEDETGRQNRKVSKYPCALGNIPEEGRSHLHGGGSLKSQINDCCVSCVWRKHVLKYRYLNSDVSLYAVDKIDIGFLYLI
jgi:hypothetical protein